MLMDLPGKYKRGLIRIILVMNHFVDTESVEEGEGGRQTPSLPPPTFPRPLLATVPPLVAGIACCVAVGVLEHVCVSVYRSLSAS